MERGAGSGSEQRGRLPGVDRPERADRIVLHVDMDCFYAACERRREPELKGEPLVVGMGYEPGTDRGAVATASYEARESGIESAQAISVALSDLPNREEVDFDDPETDVSRADTGFYRSVDLEFYEEVSEEVRTVLHDVCDTVREVSIDEAYLDVTDRTGWDVVGNGQRERTLAAGFARHLKERICREVGVIASVGVAPNMSAAKVASDYDKPNGLVVVRPGDVRGFFEDLSIEAVHGVGPVRARELEAMGITTAGDLARADLTALLDRFGERGRDLLNRARGIDERPVTPKGDPKSLNRESAFDTATDDLEYARGTIRELASEVAARAAERGALYRTIGIKVVTPPFEVSTRARSLSGPIQDEQLVSTVARSLFEEFEGERVRKLGVRVSNLQFGAADQSSLTNWESTTDQKTDETGDSDNESQDERPPRELRTGPRGQASLADFEG